MVSKSFENKHYDTDFNRKYLFISTLRRILVNFFFKYYFSCWAFQHVQFTDFFLKVATSIYLFICEYVCVCIMWYGDQRTTCGSSCFHHVGPGDQTQMVRLGSKCNRGAILLAYNLLSPISHCFDHPNHNWFILQLANSTMLKDCLSYLILTWDKR